MESSKAKTKYQLEKRNVVEKEQSNKEFSVKNQLLTKPTYLVSPNVDLVKHDVTDGLDDYKQAFDLLDRDGNGEITKADLEDFMKTRLGEHPTQSELQEMMCEVDVDGNESVNFTEFLTLMKSESKNIDADAEKDMLDAFLVFDKDRNGYISSLDLKHVMTNIGEPLNENEIEDFLSFIDEDGDGLINYQELVTVLQG